MVKFDVMSVSNVFIFEMDVNKDKTRGNSEFQARLRLICDFKFANVYPYFSCSWWIWDENREKHQHHIKWICWARQTNGGPSIILTMTSKWAISFRFLYSFFVQSFSHFLSVVFFVGRERTRAPLLLASKWQLALVSGFSSHNGNDSF